MKRKPRKSDQMTREDVHEAVKARLKDREAWEEGELQGNWEAAYGYYRGERPYPSEATTSTTVSTDVSDVLEWMLPSVLKPLVESPDVVRFDPVNPEDQEQADLESDYVHHTVMKKCEGFTKLYLHIKDALLLKNAVFFTYWDDAVTHQKEEYRDLLAPELADLLSPADGSRIEILEQARRLVPVPDPLTGAPFVIEPLPPPYLSPPTPEGASPGPQGPQGTPSGAQPM